MGGKECWLIKQIEIKPNNNTNWTKNNSLATSCKCSVLNNGIWRLNHPYLWPSKHNRFSKTLQHKWQGWCTICHSIRTMYHHKSIIVTVVFFNVQPYFYPVIDCHVWRVFNWTIFFDVVQNSHSVWRYAVE